MKIGKYLAAGVAVAIAGAALTGCSDGSTSDDSSATATSTLSAAAQAALETAYTGQGSTLSDLPSVDVPSGITLGIMSCGQSQPGCSGPAAAMQDAADELGWDSEIADGKLTPDGFAAAIRQLVADGVDAIIPIGIPCQAAQAAFQEAKDAGIVIVGGGGTDGCDPQIWDSARLWVDGLTDDDQFAVIGQLQADYAYGVNDGDVEAITLTSTGAGWGQTITDGFTDELTTLGSGEVVEDIQVSGTEESDSSFVAKVTSALVAHPEVNTLVVPVSAWLTANGLAAAIVQAGRTDITVVARGGEEAVLDLIEQGDSGVTATIGYSSDWGAWGSVDTVARILAGDDPQEIGDWVQAIDADNNLPDSGDYTGPADVDWKTAFLTAWGVE
ncbi:MAG: substrate-binding domain-containing protein [Microbacteriaceae bacterium]